MDLTASYRDRVSILRLGSDSGRTEAGMSMRKVDRNKPLVEMSKEELRDAFDEIGLGTNFRLLQEARNGDNQEIIVAVAILLPRALYVLTALEYGDGDGIERIDNFIAEIERTPGLLLDGEKLHRTVIKVTRAESIEVPE